MYNRETIRKIERGIVHILPDALLVTGGLVVAAGVGMIYTPAGVIVLGLMLLITGLKVT